MWCSFIACKSSLLTAKWNVKQENIDCEDERDMVEKMCSELALQPVATALFSSSPFRAGLIPFYPPPSTYTSPTFPNFLAW